MATLRRIGVPAAAMMDQIPRTLLAEIEMNNTDEWFFSITHRSGASNREEESSDAFVRWYLVRHCACNQMI